MFDTQHAKRPENDRSSAEPTQEPSRTKQNPGDLTRIPLYTQLAWGNQPPPWLRLPIQRKESHEGEAVQEENEATQHKENTAGLPDTLKAGVEQLSGLSMDDVQVHYNSAKPAEVQALAYTQGAEIHVGPSQEQHLAHEAWHVVQQKQGRVKPTLQAKGIAVNDDERLEQEASTMGAKAMTSRNSEDLPDRPMMILGEAEVQAVSGSLDTNHLSAQHHAVTPIATQKTASCPAKSDVIQRVVLFYWHPQNQCWGAFENKEDPVGYTLFKGQPSHPFDWNRWRTDQEYYHWWQQQLGPDPNQAPAPVAVQAPAPVAVQALQFSAPTASEDGYMTITARLNNTVIGRARYSSQEENIPGAGGKSGIELSEVFVEPEYRSRGYSTLILKHTLQCIGFEKKVWLDAQAQAQHGLNQANLTNWYGRHGFQATKHGTIMATIDFM